MRVAEITDQLDRLTQSLTTLSRLYALRLLADRDRLSKLEASGHFAVCMDLAVLIEEFAARHYRRKPALIIWPPNFHPERAGMLQGGAVELTCLAEYIRGLTRHVLDLLALIEDGTAGMLMAAPARALMGQLRSLCPRIQGDAALNIPLLLIEAPRRMLRTRLSPGQHSSTPIRYSRRPTR